MNPIVVCFAVGAVSFASCDPSARPSTPLQHRHHIDTEDCALRPDPSPRRTPDPPDHPDRRPPAPLRHLAHIYRHCTTKAAHRLTSLPRTSADPHAPDLAPPLRALYHCIKLHAFRHLDHALQADVIPLTDYAAFVTHRPNATRPLSRYAPRVLARHWPALLYDRISAFLRTHSLRLRLDNAFLAQGRSRRRDHRMFAMMVMGFMIMASILIPMGFQFLTVLGGKSLLLAKMALIMSAINGLKKIATSNVGYGFYHAPSDAHHHDHLHHGFHEKHFHLSPNSYAHPQGYN